MGKNYHHSVENKCFYLDVNQDINVAKLINSIIVHMTGHFL